MWGSQPGIAGKQSIGAGETQLGPRDISRIAVSRGTSPRRVPRSAGCSAVRNDSDDGLATAGE